MSYYQSGNRAQREAPVVFNLIIINVLVIAVQYIFDKQGYGISDKLAIHGYKTDSFQPYQIVTSMFAHKGVAHIFFNMFNLYMFGSLLEKYWGSKRFLIFYLICGLIASVVSGFILGIGVYTEPATGMRYFYDEGALGASGAIMGLFAAFAYLFPNTELLIMFIPVPVKAKWAVAFMVLIDLFGQFGPIKTGIGHYAHLAGAVTGFLIVLYWNKTNRKTFY